MAERHLRLDEALALIQKALSFAPDDPFITDSLGWEVGYTGIYGMFGSATVTGPANLELPPPLGLAVNFLVNGREVLVPMALEEPSVVASASARIDEASSASKIEKLRLRPSRSPSRRKR